MPTPEDNSTSEIKDERDALEKLNSGLLMLYFKKEIEESAYSVLHRITFGHQVVQKRQSYSSELIRVLGELNMTASFVESIDADTTIEVNGRTKYPEEQITYYVGIFFGLVHQAKDKILRLVDHMDADETTKVPYREADNIRLSKFLTKHSEVIDKIGIRNELQQWAQDSGAIGVILKKRTQHEHFISKISLNEDLQNVKMSRTFLEPNTIPQFTAVGIAHFEQIGKDSFEKYHSEIKEKQAHAVATITENLNRISQKIIDYYKVPSSYEDQAKFAVEYTDYLASLDIKNEASKDKFASNAEISLEDLLAIPQDVKDQVVAVYGVGSVFRDEFTPGSSDINMYVITKNTTKSFDNELPVTLQIISEKDLFTDEYKKDRFIIWSDGALLQGQSIEVKKKDFPLPGTELCILLNRGVIEKLEALRIRISALSDNDHTSLRLLELKGSKLMTDYIFGIAMSNKPFYTSSRKKKYEYIKEVFPDQNLILPIEQVYYAKGRTMVKDDFILLLDAYLTQARKNYDKQLAILTPK